MSDADIIGMRIMQGISKGIADLNNIVQIKNAAEEGERKRLEWERNEAEQNRKVNWRLHPAYMTAPDDIKEMYDRHLVDGGYSKDGKTVTIRDLGNANKAFVNNKELMGAFYEAGIRETGKAITTQFTKRMEELAKPKPNEEVIKRIDANIKSLRMKEETLRNDAGKYYDSIEARELNKAQLLATVAKMKAETEKADAERTIGIPAIARHHNAAADALGREKTNAADVRKQENLTVAKLMIANRMAQDYELINKSFLEQLQNPKLGDAEYGTKFSQYSEALKEIDDKYETEARIMGVDLNEVRPKNVLKHRQQGVIPTVPGSGSTTVDNRPAALPGTTPADVTGESYDAYKGIQGGGSVIPDFMYTGVAPKANLPASNAKTPF